MARVVIALSGGVDSSVAAALLVEQGYEVVGMMMKLWAEPGSETQNRCCTPDAMQMAKRVAARLGIPFYTIDAKDIFNRVVVNYFLDGYQQGITPNPCLVCNRHIRWEFLLDNARSIGADFMATGHYARLRREPSKPVQLLRAFDERKDQSYVLHVLDQAKLNQALFPLGELTKTQVRQLAHDYKLPVAERPESQDLCFLGSEDYRSFLQRHKPGLYIPGPIYHSNGTLLGQHQGLANFTIGQRKGLGISSPDPLYVIRKDNSSHALIVGEKKHLGGTTLVADKVNWIAGSPPVMPLRVQVKIRYKANFAWGELSSSRTDQIQVNFEEPLRDITPGQAAVFYQDEVCLGGGIIMNSRNEP